MNVRCLLESFRIKTIVFVQKQRMMAEGQAAAAAQFGCTHEELTNLMENRGREGYDKIQADYGGITELCKRLKTSVTDGELF